MNIIVVIFLFLSIIVEVFFFENNKRDVIFKVQVKVGWNEYMERYYFEGFLVRRKVLKSI